MASNVLDKIWDLLFKPGEAEAYQEDPQAYLEEHDLNECTPEQINEAVSMAYEKGPVSQGASVNVGGNQNVGTGPGSAPPPASPPPPPPMDPTLPAAEALEQTVNYYVTNVTETNVDDRDTYNDSSVNTNVLAEEGADVNLDIDNQTAVASGDNAVAVGDDNEGVINTGENSGVIAEDSNLDGVAVGDGAFAADDITNSQINTGDDFAGIQANQSTLEGNAVGDGNTVISDSTNVATGGGSVSDDDVNLDIDASGSNVDLENVNFGQGNTIDDSETYTDSFNQDNDVTDSYNQDNDVTQDFSQDNDVTTETNVTTEYENSFNTASVISDESFNVDSAVADDASTATDSAAEELDV